MLVIISDLHLTDGSCAASTVTDAFQTFSERLRELTASASWRADGSYCPVDRIDLVLLGDVLDLIRSTRWLQSTTRPWDSAQSPQMAEVVGDIVNRILQHNAQSVQFLRRLAADGAVKVPPATQSGKPDESATPVSVPVRTYYMVGNCDWHLHLPGTRYDLIRQKVAHQLGLSNSHTAPFPHDPVECPEVLDILRRHRVLARHGDLYDPLNFAEDRDASSLGDAIVIELMIRFAAQVERTLGNNLPSEVHEGLRETHNVRPLLLVPVWIDGLLERCCPNPSVRKQVKSIWDALADEFLELPFVRDGSPCSSYELIDGLEQALKFSKRNSIGWASKISTWLHGLRGSSTDSYYQHALSEQDFRNRRARHIVYGHTHHAETVPLDASYADSFVLNQMYFNAGTWRRLYRSTILAPGGHEYIPCQCLSYLAFFQGDERGGRAFETWSGTVGASPLDRIDHPRATAYDHQAAAQQVPTSSISVGPPHFLAATVVSEFDVFCRSTGANNGNETTPTKR